MNEMNRDIRYFTRDREESFYEWLDSIKKLMMKEHGVQMSFREYRNATTQEVLEIGMREYMDEGHGIGYSLTCGNLLNKEMVVVF